MLHLGYFLAITGALALLFEAARRVGLRQAQRAERAHDDRDDATGHLISSALALLGLLIGFTFAMAIDRFDDRRHTVVAEANAISTTYLRVALLEDSIARELRGAVAAYAHDRRAFVAAGEDPVALKRVADRLAAQQDAIWARVKIALNGPDGPRYATSLLGAVNEMFDLAATRQALLDGHIPPLVLIVLIGFAAATAYLLGYAGGESRTRHRAATLLVFLLVAIAIALIIDLDRPRIGLIQIDQSPIERVIESIDQAQLKDHS